MHRAVTPHLTRQRDTEQTDHHNSHQQNHDDHSDHPP
jgi:hypothetical protein